MNAVGMVECGINVNRAHQRRRSLRFADRRVLDTKSYRVRALPKPDGSRGSTRARIVGSRRMMQMMFHALR